LKEKTMHRMKLAALVLVLAATTSVACKKEAPPPPPPEPTAVPTAAPTPAPAVTISDVSLGSSLGADKKVAKASDTFKPKDTIFAVVSTDASTL